MAVQSETTELGVPLPDAILQSEDGQVELRELLGEGPKLVVFMANHCPAARHVEAGLGELAAEFAERGLSVVAVASNDLDAYPEDDVEGMAAQSERSGWDFPYLVDTDQSLARTIGAVCTPDFFLFDASDRLVYRGAFDGSSPKNGVPLTGDDLRAAVTAVLDGTPVSSDQRPAMGCGIKWRDDDRASSTGV